MKHYEITLTLTCTYDVEGDTKEQALMQAEEYFAEAIPNIISCECLGEVED